MIVMVIKNKNKVQNAIKGGINIVLIVGTKK